MKKNVKFSLSIMFLLMIGSVSEAQKFGHLNSGNILVELPETGKADSLLKIFQDSLVKIGQEKGKKLEEEYFAFVKMYQAGELTPVAAQKKQDEFQQKQKELQEFESMVASAVARRREELIAPILIRLQNAINKIGKEQGYTMIFDTSVFNTILFSRESDDLEPLIKKELGVK